MQQRGPVKRAVCVFLWRKSGRKTNTVCLPSWQYSHPARATAVPQSMLHNYEGFRMKCNHVNTHSLARPCSFIFVSLLPLPPSLLSIMQPFIFHFSLICLLPLPALVSPSLSSLHLLSQPVSLPRQQNQQWGPFCSRSHALLISLSFSMYSIRQQVH